MSEPDQKKLSVFTGWFENGPWRSKTVLAALVVVVVGLWFWYSDTRNSPPPAESARPAAEATGLVPANPSAPADASATQSRKPLPAYVWVGASYVAGYCIGWLFRRLLRLILLVCALAIALLAYGKFAGFDLKPAQEKVKQGGQWAQREATAAKDYFKNMLPSATAGGVGIFLGFLRRKRARLAKLAA